jgi:hypothetical protein
MPEIHFIDPNAMACGTAIEGVIVQAECYAVNVTIYIPIGVAELIVVISTAAFQIPIKILAQEIPQV